LVLAGCGDASEEERGDPAASRIVRKAGEKTQAAGTARIGMIGKVDDKQVLHASGLTRLDRDAMRLDMTFDVASGDLPAGTRGTVLMLGDEGYYRDGDRWLHLSADALGPSFSTGFESLSYLGAVTDAVEPHGTSSIRGEPVRVYSTTIDLDGVSEQLPAGEQEAYDRERKRTGAPDRIPLEVSVDDRGRMARLDYTLPVQGHEVFFRIDLYDFGAKGDLSVPERVVEAP
jgi:hypothetical protein